MTDPASFALLDQTTRDTARRYLAEYGPTLGAKKAGIARHTLYALAANQRVSRGTVLAMAEALGLLAISSLPAAS